MKVIVAGSREFTDYQVVCRVLHAHRQQITQIITGGARGADRLGYRWSWKHQVPHKLFRAEWERWGKSAGVRRNCRWPGLVMSWWHFGRSPPAGQPI